MDAGRKFFVSPVTCAIGLGERHIPRDFFSLMPVHVRAIDSCSRTTFSSGAGSGGPAWCGSCPLRLALMIVLTQGWL
jgi:hypothetical protein